MHTGQNDDCERLRHGVDIYSSDGERLGRSEIFSLSFGIGQSEYADSHVSNLLYNFGT